MLQLLVFNTYTIRTAFSALKELRTMTMLTVSYAHEHITARHQILTLAFVAPWQLSTKACLHCREKSLLAEGGHESFVFRKIQPLIQRGVYAIITGLLMPDRYYTSIVCTTGCTVYRQLSRRNRSAQYALTSYSWYRHTKNWHYYEA